MALTRTITLCAVSVCLGALVWIPHGDSLGFLIVLAPLIGGARSTGARFCVALSYSIGCLSALLPTLSHLVPSDCLDLVLAATLWCVVTASPWLLIRTGYKTSTFVTAVIALIATAFPPVGVIDPFSPLVAATDLAPGLGLLGLVITTVSFAFLILMTVDDGWFPYPSRYLVGLLGLSLLPWILPPVHRAHTALDPIALSGYFGQEPHTLVAQRARIDQLSRLITAVQRRHPQAKLFVFPEFFLGRFDRAVATWLRPISLNLAHHDQEGIAGAVIALPSKHGKRVVWTDGVVAFGWYRALVATRQPAPLAEWRPWNVSRFPAFWWPRKKLRDGILLGRIDYDLRRARDTRIRIAVSICYAGTLAWTWLWNELSFRTTPTLVIAPESFLWTRNTQPRLLEARLVRAWGRLYGVRVLIARAEPPPCPVVVNSYDEK